jgi:serine/threonine protein kinase
MSQYNMPQQVQQRRPAVRLSENEFDTMKVIGRGSYGRVLLVRKRDTRRVFAMKVLKKVVIAARGEIEHTMTEKKVLAKIKHPFLVRLHYAFQNEKNLYMVMDFVNGGELFHHLTREGKFTEERTRFYAAQICSGMAHLHSHGIIYRDLKPENLLLSAQGNIIMTDFGLSKEGLNSQDSLTATFCGTPEYIAPEIIKGEKYTKAIDWWAVGTIIFEMLNGLPPFYTEDQTESYNLILFAELKIPAYFSAQVGDIIRQFLNRDPKMRLQDMDRIRAHPWFRSVDFNRLENLEIPPPFVPVVKDVEDVGNIDEEFLMEDITDNDEETDAMYRNRRFRQEDFAGFSFNGDEY